MKRLIADVYKIIYKASRARTFSIYAALTYVTCLHIVTIQGLALLLEGWLSIMRVFRALFTFPFILAPAAVFFTVNLLITLPFKNLKKERRKDPLMIPVIVYSVACLMLFIYIRTSYK